MSTLDVIKLSVLDFFDLWVILVPGLILVGAVALIAYNLYEQSYNAIEVKMSKASADVVMGTALVLIVLLVL